jgi:hypothetical protein
MTTFFVYLAILLATIPSFNGSPVTLRRTEAFAAEQGAFILAGQKAFFLTSQSFRVQNPETLKWSYPENKQGDVYSYILENGRWRSSQDSAPDASLFRRLSLCDQANQIDLRGTDKDIDRVLPLRARLKVDLEIEDNVHLLIYSRTSPGLFYATYIALVSTKGRVATVVTKHLVSDHGMFCGLEFNSGMAAVLMDEPSASSDFLAVYTFTLP